MNDWSAFAAWASGPLPLPPLARQRAQDAVIDTVACLVAGLGSPAARAAAGQAQAFRWAVAAHALDFDDYDRPSVGHPSVVLVPVVLALGGSGEEVLQAYVAGLEAIDRLGEMVNPEHYERGWHATTTLGAVGAAVAAGRCLKLDSGQMLTAMSLAAGIASGLKAQFGSSGKPLGVGFSVLHGIMAAELARDGADARAVALDAFCALYGPPEPRALRLGERLAIEQYGLIVKLQPCCGYLGRIVPACIALSAEVDVGEIAEVIVEAPPRNARVIAYGIPETPDQARFSAPYCVAVALLQGRVGISDFSEDAIRRPDVLALARRVRLRESAGQSDRDLAPEDPDRLTMRMRDGKEIERVLRTLPGSPEEPASRTALLAKLADCGGGEAEGLLVSLPEMDDIGPLRRWLESQG